MPLLVSNTGKKHCHCGGSCCTGHGLGVFKIIPKRMRAPGLGIMRHRSLLGGLGDAATTASGVPSWIPIASTYNEGVVSTERNAAGAAEAPDDSPAMQAAINAAIAAGNDPTTVMNLWQNGADLVQMQLLANNAVTPDQITAPGTTPQTDAQLEAAYDAASGSSSTSTSPLPTISWCGEDSIGLGLNNCEYLAIGVALFAAIWLFKK